MMLRKVMVDYDSSRKEQRFMVGVLLTNGQEGVGYGSDFASACLLAVESIFGISIERISFSVFLPIDNTSTDLYYRFAELAVKAGERQRRQEVLSI